MSFFEFDVLGHMKCHYRAASVVMSCPALDNNRVSNSIFLDLCHRLDVGHPQRAGNFFNLLLGYISMQIQYEVSIHGNSRYENLKYEKNKKNGYQFIKVTHVRLICRFKP